MEHLFLKFTLNFFFKQAACWKLIVEIQTHSQLHFGHEFSKLSVPLCPVSLSVYCTPQPCSSSDVGLASSTQMWRLPLVGEGEPHTQALTRAGALLPLSLILTSATGLIAQVLEVHLHLLAVLLHWRSTCLGTDGGATEDRNFPHTLILSSMHPGPWGGQTPSGIDASLDWGGRGNTCARQQDLPTRWACSPLVS